MISYLLPTCHGICTRNKAATSDNATVLNEKKWSKKDAVGILLDILLIAAVSIAASLALCLHFGIPLGSLNVFSSVAFPLSAALCVISGALTILLAAHVIRKLYAPQEQTKTPTADSESTVEELSSESESEDNKKKSPQTGTPFKLSGGISPPPSPSKKTPSTTRLSGHTIQAPLQFAGRFYKTYQLELPKIQNSMEASILNLQAAVVEDPTPTDLWGRLWQGGKQIVNNMVQNACTAMKQVVTPGEIQMRFYRLQVDFILEQFLRYDENSQTIDGQKAVPLAHYKKIQKLSERQFNTDRNLEIFKKEIISILLEHQGDDYYTRFYILNAIETAYNKPQSSPELRTFLMQLCHKLYTQFDGLTYSEQIVNKFLEDPKNPKELTFENLAKVFEEDQTKIKNLTAKDCGSGYDAYRNSFGGVTGMGYSPMIDNNFACLLWRESYGQHTVNVIRFGTPTGEVLNDQAKILGQMELAVQQCEKQKETLLSFQLQSDDSFATNTEKSRLEAAFQLADNHPETCFIGHLDMDSHFWHQTRQKIDLDDQQQPRNLKYAAFKADLVEHMKNLRMSANLEKIVKTPLFEKDLEKLADRTRAYFSKDQDLENMTQKMRCDFLFFFYNRYRQYLHNKVKPTYSADQCRDSKDRTMSKLATAYLMNTMDLNTHNDKKQLAIFRSLANSIGLIALGQPMTDSRYQRFHSALTQLTSLKEKPSIRSYITGQSICEGTYNHTFSQFPCDAFTKEDKIRDEYLKCELLRTTQAFIPVMPVSKEIDVDLLVTHLYRNSLAKFVVEAKDGTFGVVDTRDDTAVANGEYKVENGMLYLNIKRLAA